MSNSSDTVIGFVLNITACFAFGFMFVPLRKFQCGDGSYMLHLNPNNLYVCFLTFSKFVFVRAVSNDDISFAQ